MKIIAAASIACLMIAAGSVAQAAPATSSFDADTAVSLYADPVGAVGVPYDRCHHQASGTAHAACGSLTGGPSGSLF